MKNPEYAVVNDDSLPLLQTQVQAMLADGWECQGGIALSSYFYSQDGEKESGILWAQALVRREVNQ